MALVYDLDEKCAKSECTEEEMKKKSPEEKTILNDCDEAETDKNHASDDLEESAIEDLGDFIVVDESAGDVAAVAAAIGIGAAAIGGMIAVAVRKAQDAKKLKLAVKEYEESHPDLIPITKLERKKFRLSGDDNAPIDMTHEIKAKKTLILKREKSQFDNYTGGYVWYHEGKPFMALTLDVKTDTTISPVFYGGNSSGVGYAVSSTTTRNFKWYYISELSKKYSGYYSNMAPNDISKTRGKIEYTDTWLDNLLDDYKEKLKDSKKKSIKEAVDSDFTYNERLAFAKEILEDAKAQKAFDGYIQESCDALCLDEGYIKNVKQAHSLTSGKQMKAAKAHAKAAKIAAKSGDYTKAVTEQKAYVDALKQLVEECNKIEDDTKMIVIANSIIKGMLATLASSFLLVTQNISAAKLLGKRKDAKEGKDVPDNMTDDEKNDKMYQYGSDYVKSKTGKAAIAVSAAISIVVGIISGKASYRKDMLKYTGGIEKENKWEVPKSRVDAQQKLRRMIRLAEQLLNEFEDIQRVESK